MKQYDADINSACYREGPPPSRLHLFGLPEGTDGVPVMHGNWCPEPPVGWTGGGVRNQLPGLNAELKICGRCVSPLAGDLHPRRIVEGRLNFDGVESRKVVSLRSIPAAEAQVESIRATYRAFPCCNALATSRVFYSKPLPASMIANQASLFSVPQSSLFPDGFRYCPEAITPQDENRLLAEMAGLPFKEFQFHGFEGKRRVVSFGWRYDFSEHKALPADPIPPFLRDTCDKVQAASGFAFRGLEQVLVTEYAPGAPIGWHKDRPVFGDVMGLSLLSQCSFRLRRPRDNGKWERTSVHLEPRSAYFLSGPARWQWEHSIPPLDALRYSITFRTFAHL